MSLISFSELFEKKHGKNMEKTRNRGPEYENHLRSQDIFYASGVKKSYLFVPNVRYTLMLALTLNVVNSLSKRLTLVKFQLQRTSIVEVRVLDFFFSPAAPAPHRSTKKVP